MADAQVEAIREVCAMREKLREKPSPNGPSIIDKTGKKEYASLKNMFLYRDYSAIATEVRQFLDDAKLKDTSRVSRMRAMFNLLRTEESNADSDVDRAFRTTAELLLLHADTSAAELREMNKLEKTCFAVQCAELAFALIERGCEMVKLQPVFSANELSGDLVSQLLQLSIAQQQAQLQTGISFRQ
jgi:hypothetical protein